MILTKGKMLEIPPGKSMPKHSHEFGSHNGISWRI